MSMEETRISDSQERERLLLERIAELERQLAEAQCVIQVLKEQVETMQRAGKRQAVSPRWWS